VRALEVRGLSRRYGSRMAVADLDLTVEEGDVYGFLGPNGAGKTTAMRCILGLIRRDSGAVTIFGESDPRKQRAHVGAIVETPAFHGWMSGRKNLEQAAAFAGLSRSEASREIERVLDRVGLTERSKDKTSGYSLGMRQRLAIARALLGQPKLLFLDEPTNGLDPAGMREMRELIRSLALHDRITVFVSSHLLPEVQAICNRVGILKQGQLVAEGTVAELVERAKKQTLVEVDAADQSALRDALEAMPGVVVQGQGKHGRILVQLADTTAVELNLALVAQQIPVSALVPLQADLEDVFLEVVS